MRKREVTKTFVKRSHKKSEFSRAFTISELIEILSNIKENHGDIDCVFVEGSVYTVDQLLCHVYIKRVVEDGKVIQKYVLFH